MGQSAAALHRTTDAAWVNAIANDPTVRKGAGWTETMDELDLTAAVENPDNIVLANEYGGFIFVMLDKDERIYDVHVAFLPKGRGAAAVKATQAAFDWIFNNTPSRGVVCAIPSSNKPSAWLARRGGMLAYAVEPNGWFVGGDEPCDLIRFAISRALWRSLRDAEKT